MIEIPRFPTSMDYFSDSNDEEESESPSVTQLFVEMMLLKPTLKGQDPGGQAVALKRKVLMLEGVDDAVHDSARLCERLRESDFDVTTLGGGEEAKSCGSAEYDVIVTVSCCGEDSVKASEGLLCGGGYFVTLASTQNFTSLFPPAIWAVERARRTPSTSTEEVVSICKRAVAVNASAARYWGALAGEKVAKERTRVDAVTVCLSMEERRLCVFGNTSHDRAVSALRDHGICIFPGLFKAEVVAKWAEAALGDMRDIVEILKKERGIDLFQPQEGPFIENFHEMSMREALRCDIRNGKRIKAAMRETDQGEKGFKSLRSHPGLVGVLLDVMNPVGDPVDAKGNWGRFVMIYLLRSECQRRSVKR